MQQTGTQAATWDASIASFMTVCEGAYALTLLTRNALYGVRDRFGLRPLCIGEIKKVRLAAFMHVHPLRGWILRVDPSCLDHL